MQSLVNKYFLYRHIRNDKNEVFYVGVGTKRKKSQYERAFSKRNRNKYWNNIINITNYSIDIIFECDSEYEIYEKEKEFILLYGRKDLKTGTLVNLTNGGEGLKGYDNSEKHKKVYQYSHKGELMNIFKSITNCSEILNISTSEIVRACKKKGTINNFHFRYEEIDSKEILLSRYESTSLKLSKPVYEINSLNEIINVFKNSTEAALYFKKCKNTIDSYCKGLTKNNSINIRY